MAPLILVGATKAICDRLAPADILTFFEKISTEGATVRGVGLATARDTTCSNGTTTCSYEQEGIEWGRLADTMTMAGGVAHPGRAAAERRRWPERAALVQEDSGRLW